VDFGNGTKGKKVVNFGFSTGYKGKKLKLYPSNILNLTFNTGNKSGKHRF